MDVQPVSEGSSRYQFIALKKDSPVAVRAITFAIAAFWPSGREPDRSPRLTHAALRGGWKRLTSDMRRITER